MAMVKRSVAKDKGDSSREAYLITAKPLAQTITTQRTSRSVLVNLGRQNAKLRRFWQSTARPGLAPQGLGGLRIYSPVIANSDTIECPCFLGR